MKKLSLLLVVMIFCSSVVSAQEDVKPAKYENVTWHRIVLINYNPGQVSRAKEILTQYQSAGDAVNLKGPARYWMETGEYDLMLVWTMEGGPSDLEWDRSPNGIKWRAQMIKQLGSEEALKKLQQEYSSLISNSTSYISRKEN
jgi:hypothetical protein